MEISRDWEDGAFYSGSDKARNTERNEIARKYNWYRRYQLASVVTENSVTIKTTEGASGVLGTMDVDGPSNEYNGVNRGAPQFEGAIFNYSNRYPIRWDRCAAPAAHRRDWWLAFKSDYQVFCPKASLPSPIFEYNTACCGARNDWERSHYDDTRQVCCNEADSIPSSRDGYEKLDTSLSGPGAKQGVVLYTESDIHNFSVGYWSETISHTNNTHTWVAHWNDSTPGNTPVGYWNFTPGQFVTHHTYAHHTRTSHDWSKVRCCGKADYHSEWEICCDSGANRPAPFVWSQSNADEHVSDYYLRNIRTRTTKVRGSFQEHGGDWTDSSNTGRDTSNFARTENEIALKARWKSIPQEFFPLRWDSCCAQVEKKKDAHYFDARRAENEWANEGSGGEVTRGQVCCAGYDQLQGPSPPNQFNDECCGPAKPDFRRHYSHFNSYHQVCCH
jgi:hypothetical protein